MKTLQEMYQIYQTPTQGWVYFDIYEKKLKRLNRLRKLNKLFDLNLVIEDDIETIVMDEILKSYFI